MAGKVISIEIGYSLTRVCEVDYKAKTHRVYRRFTIPTPAGVINDGMLSVSAELIETLSKALANNKMKSKQVVFTVTSGKIVSREVIIPLVKENRINDVVTASASEFFPVDLSQYELAYNILGTVEEEKGSQQYKLLVMAVPQELLRGYYVLAKELKRELAAIDYAGNSIYQVAKDKAASGTSLVIKIDERSTLVMAVQNSVLTFTRSVPYGVGEAIQVVMNSERWANTTVLEATNAMSLNDCTVFPEIIEALVPLVGGISRVIDYYAFHNMETSIQQIYITGIGADIKGMVEFLTKELNYPFEVLRQVEGWKLEQSFRTQFYSGYLACVGAAVAPLGFKNDEKKKKKKEKSFSGSKSGFSGASIAYTVLAVGVIVGVVLAVISTRRLMEAESQNIELKTLNSNLEEIIPIYNEYVATQSSYNLIRSMYSMTENRNEDLVEFLEELESKLPADVHVISFTSTISGVVINMTVSTKSEAAVAIEQLRTFESLVPDSVTVNSVIENTDDETGAASVDFSIAADYQDMSYQLAEEDTEE